jgi:hypothetical protein
VTGTKGANPDGYSRDTLVHHIDAAMTWIERFKLCEEGVAPPAQASAWKPPTPLKDSAYENTIEALERVQKELAALPLGMKIDKQEQRRLYEAGRAVKGMKAILGPLQGGSRPRTREIPQERHLRGPIPKVWEPEPESKKERHLANLVSRTAFRVGSGASRDVAADTAAMESANEHLAELGAARSARDKTAMKGRVTREQAAELARGRAAYITDIKQWNAAERVIRNLREWLVHPDRGVPPDGGAMPAPDVHKRSGQSTAAVTDSADNQAFLHPRLNHLYGHLRHVLIRTGSVRKQIASLLRDPIEVSPWVVYQAPEDTADYRDLVLGKAREQGRVLANIYRLETEFGPLEKRNDGTLELDFSETTDTRIPPKSGVYGRIFLFDEARKLLEPGKIDRLAHRLDGFHIFLQKWRRAILDARAALSAATREIDGKTNAPVAERPSTRMAEAVDALFDAVPSDPLTMSSCVIARQEWLDRLDAAQPAVVALVRGMRSAATLPARKVGRSNARRMQRAARNRKPPRSAKMAPPDRNRKATTAGSQQGPAPPLSEAVFAKLTTGERRLWQCLEQKALTAEELAAPAVMDTSAQTIRGHVRGVRLKAGHDAIKNKDGAGYWRPDAPPDWSAILFKRKRRIRPT